MHNQQLAHSRLATDPSSGLGPKSVFFLDLWLCVGCAQHDCTISLKKGVCFQQCHDAGLLRKLHIVVAIARHSDDLTILYLGTWLQQVAFVVDESHLPAAYALGACGLYLVSTRTRSMALPQ